MGNQATKETVNVTNNSVVANNDKSHFIISAVQLAVIVTILVLGGMFFVYKKCTQHFKNSVRLNARAELNDILVSDVRKTAENRKTSGQ